MKKKKFKQKISYLYIFKKNLVINKLKLENIFFSIFDILKDPDKIRI